MLDDFFKQLDFLNFCLGNNFILIFRSKKNHLHLNTGAKQNKALAAALLNNFLWFFFPPSSFIAHPPTSYQHVTRNARGSTDLSAKNRDNVYCEVYNYLTPYLLGKAAILIHCPLHNRR